MPKNWKTYKLSEITSVITKGTTPSTYGFDFEDSGITYIRAQSLNYDGKINEDVFSYVSEEAHAKLKRSQLKVGDILFSMAGAYLGMVGMVKASHCPANTNQAVGIIRIDDERVHAKFVEYSLRNPVTVAYVNSQSGQSAQPNINLAEIGSLSFPFPPLSEQKVIASILSALDDKIELNLQQNKTLEEMAMALYKHWFVDFGPFQDVEFVESELGMIPKGWEARSICDFAEILNSKRVPLSTRVRSKRKGKYAYYGASGIIDDYKFDGEYVIVSEDGENLRSRNTPIAFSAVGKFWVNNHAHILKGIKNGINELIICHFAQLDMSPYLTGAVQPKLNKQNLLQVKITMPKDISVIAVLLEDFDSISNSLIYNSIENQTLTTLRDTLLPKLISGEVRVKDVQEQLKTIL